MDSADELADVVIRRLEERGAAALALADLMALESHLADSLRIVRAQIDAVARLEQGGLNG